MMIPSIAHFTIRVYGILVNENHEVLLSDEYEDIIKFTKFPGGGMNFGEGTLECLKRECREELGQEVEPGDHFYTTDFFQKSAFMSDHQVISIFYSIRLTAPPAFRTSEKRFDFPSLTHGIQSLRWVKINEWLLHELSFPIERRVGELLIEKFK